MAITYLPANETKMRESSSWLAASRLWQVFCWTPASLFAMFSAHFLICLHVCPHEAYWKRDVCLLPIPLGSVQIH